MLLCGLAAVVFCALPNDLAHLAGRARAMAKDRKARGDQPSVYEPGHYHLGAIHFKLTRRLSGGVAFDVAGYAVGRAVLAAIAPEFEFRRVFVDHVTQELYEVRELIARDNEVTFYRVRRKHPLSLFAHLHFRFTRGLAVPGGAYALDDSGGTDSGDSGGSDSGDGGDSGDLIGLIKQIAQICRPFFEDWVLGMRCGVNLGANFDFENWRAKGIQHFASKNVSSWLTVEGEYKADDDDDDDDNTTSVKWDQTGGDAIFLGAGLHAELQVQFELGWPTVGDILRFLLWPSILNPPIHYVLTFNLDVKGKAELGFNLSYAQNAIQFTVKPPDIPIMPFGWTNGLGFEGWEISAGLFAYGRVIVHNLGIIFPEPLAWVRGLNLEISWEGSIASDLSDINIKWPTFKLDSFAEQNLEYDSATFWKNIRFVGEVEIEGGAALKLVLGPAGTVLRAGASIRIWVEFGGDSTLCTSPYLFGSLYVQLYLVFNWEGLVIFGFALLKPVDKRWPLFPRFGFAPTCLFSSENSWEGLNSSVARKLEDGYVAQARDVLFQPSSLWEALDYRLLLDNTLELEIKYSTNEKPEDPTPKRCKYPPFNFDYKSGGHTIRFPKQRLVVAEAWDNTQLVSTARAPYWWPLGWSSVKDWRIWDKGDNLQHKFNDPGDGIGEAHLTIWEATHVESEKEFTGKGSLFLSFRPSFQSGTVLGVVRHSVGKGSTEANKAYSAPLLTLAFDDAGYNERADDYIARDELAVSLLTLTSYYDAAIYIKFWTNVPSPPWNRSETCFAWGASGVPEEEGGILVANQPYGGDTFRLDSLSIIQMYTTPDLNVSIFIQYNPLENETVEFLLPFRSIDRQGGFEVSSKEMTLFRDPDDDNLRMPGQSPVDFVLSFKRDNPNVVFELPNKMEAHHRGIIARVFQTAGTDPVSATFKVNEMYGIFRILGVANDWWDWTYLAVEVVIVGATPLCKHHVMGNDTFFVPLTAGETRFKGNAHIPFRRTNGTAGDVDMQLIEVYTTTPDAMCRPDAEVWSYEAGRRLGCIESVYGNPMFFNSWALLPLDGRDPNTGSRVASDTALHRLWLFDAPVPNKQLFHLGPTSLTVPEGLAVTYLEENISRALLRDPTFAVPIYRVDASHLYVTELDKAAIVLPRDVSKDCFHFKPTGAQEHQITVYCIDNIPAFCQTKFVFDGEGYALLEYGSSDGVDDTQRFEDDAEHYLLLQVSRQLVKSTGSRVLSKSWVGPITQTANFNGTYPVEWIIDLTNKDRVLIGATLGGIDVPLNAAHYFDDADDFFENVGVNIPDDGVTPQVAAFTADGRPIIGEKYFDPSKFESGTVAVETVLGIPPEMVSSQSITYIRPFPLALVLGVVGGVLLIVVVVLVVLIVRRRRRGESSLDNIDPEVETAYEEVRGNAKDTNWLLMKYDESKPSSKVTVSARGPGGLAEMKKNIDDPFLGFAYLRLEVGEVPHRQSKFIFIKYVSRGTTLTAKQKQYLESGDIEQIVRQSALLLKIESKDDLTEQVILDRLKQGASTPAGKSTLTTPLA